MLRLHFGIDDLARTTFEMPSVIDDIAGSAQSVQQPHSRVRRQFQGARMPLPPAARPLLELAAAHGDVPGFLIPEATGTVEELLDLVMATPPAQLRADLEAATATSPRAAWASELATGRGRAMDLLGAAMDAFHREVVAPMRPGFRRIVTAELGRLAWQAATLGMESVLNSMHPAIKWREGRLDVDLPVDADVHLEGRGLIISPSAAWSRPGFTFHWRDQLGLIYPVQADWAAPSAVADDPNLRLGTVLGATRAKVLTALAEGPAEGHTTSSLATSLGISLASASSHAAALRGAGLVTTRRAGRAVRHTLSDLGRRMVTAEPSAEPGNADLRLLEP